MNRRSHCQRFANSEITVLGEAAVLQILLQQNNSIPTSGSGQPSHGGKQGIE
ncbi:MAG: hypothetical protein VXX36_00920 [Verrucomicrobiota bacterium]|nr:hypothetical protein [Verrucomicrobiota bacterium]